MAEWREEWPPRYIKIGIVPIAEGTFGKVWKVRETTGQDSADNPTSHRALKEQETNWTTMDLLIPNKPVYPLRAYRELLFLRTFRGHPNIIYLFDAFPIRINGEMAKLCMVAELMDMDLSAATSSGTSLKNQTPFIVYGILCGINYIHSGRVFHRDLKPANVGVNMENGRITQVKLLDFGLARKLAIEMTDVVQTLYYRAPEVWTQPRRYTESIDVWSVGCILAELILGQVLLRGPLVRNGQLSEIHNFLGSPGESFIETNVDEDYHHLFYPRLNEAPRPIADLESKASGQERELLKNIFLWNTTDRWTAAQCLAHPYFSDLVARHGNDGAYTGPLPDDSFEDRENVPLQVWKDFVDEGISAIKLTL